MKYAKLNPVTLKVGQGHSYTNNTIPFNLHRRVTHAKYGLARPKAILRYPADYVLYINIHHKIDEVEPCDLESRSKPFMNIQSFPSIFLPSITKSCCFY